MQASDLLEHALAALPHTGASGEELSFLAVPGRDAPRWLLQNHAGDLGPALANWSPYRLSSRVKWNVIRAANRLGVLRRLPSVDVVEVRPSKAIDWPALGWNGAAPPCIAVYVGTPGPAQKLVMHLVDPVARTCEAIVKVPLAADATTAILREAATLAALAGEQYPCAPRLLRLDCARDISTQQFLAGKPGSRRLLPEYFDLLRSLMLPDEETSLSAHSAVWEPEAHFVSDCDVDVMQAALAELDDERRLPACWVHGDFAPWNIRQRPALAPALIDWEEAQPGGLPLHDAYHFLHIQDFLFAGKPTLHAADLARFASTLGIAPQQGQRLEIAYLAQAYLQCTVRGDRSRAAFLRTTLAQAVGQCADNSLRRAPSPRLLPTRDGAASLAEVRAGLFGAVVAGLNTAGIPYCVLSGYEKTPDNGEPDVDIMVRAPDQRRIPDLLARVAHSTGALLVQSIQHETSACYSILARPEGQQIAHLDVDCYGDYRKQARTWLRADQVIAGRRSYRGFHVPSIADEFTYYLLKKVLKQSINSYQLTRLQELLASNQTECRKRIARYWPAEAALIRQAIAGHNLAWFQQRLPVLDCELQASLPVEPALQRCKGKVYEFTRLFRRAVQPTGIWVVIAGGEMQQRTHLANDLASRLAPAFRRARTMAALVDRSFLATPWEVLAARMRSTLVISVDNDFAISGRLAPCFVSPDLVLVLSAREIESTPGLNGIVHLRAVEDAEEIAQRACDAVLQWLASRLQKRLNLPHSPRPLCAHDASASAAQPVELSPARSN